MNVKTTLSYYGRTEEAVEFYCQAIEAEKLFLMRFRDLPDQSSVAPHLSDKIFHATFRVGSTELMASDVGYEPSSESVDFAGFALAIRIESVDRAERLFAALSEGGEVLMDLAETFFALRYGVVIDRFGVSWKITVERED